MPVSLKLIDNHPDMKALRSMDAQSYRQLDIRGAAGTCDEEQIVMIFGFRKDLMHIGPQHFGADDGEMDARQKRNCPRTFSRESKHKSSCFRKQIVRFCNAQIAERHFMFTGIR